MRVGVVGCGYWGSKHVRVFTGLAGVESVVAIDSDPVRRHDLGRAFPSLSHSVDLSSCLNAIDAVVIATPPRTHFNLAITAIRAGKHVLVEKPLAVSMDEARKLVEAAQQHGVTLMVGHTFEYNPAVWRLKEIIDSGELGDLYYLDAARLNLGLYQSDVNVVWDLAPHDISILNHLLGAPPTTVQAWGFSHAHAYLEDVAYLRLGYEHRDVSAHVHVSWLDPQKVRRLTVVGSRKMAVYDDVVTDERIRVYDKGVEVNDDGASVGGVPMTYRHGSVISPYVAFREPLMLEAEHFVNRATSGLPPATDGANGLAVVAVLEAAQRSLLERREVVVEPIAGVAAVRA